MDYTDTQIKERMEQIDKMSHIEMASLWRFAPVGHPFFDRSLPFFEHFEKRFKAFGGMTSEVSKAIGW